MGFVVQMKGWANPNEADGHMRYPKNMFHQIVSVAGGITEMRFYPHLVVGHQLKDKCQESELTGIED